MEMIFGTVAFLRPILHCFINTFGCLQNRVLPSWNMSHSLDLENFATASRSCCQQNSSTVELVEHTDDGWRAVNAMHPPWTSSSSFICSNQLNKKTHTWSTREQEQDKKGTEYWRLHFAHKKKKKNKHTRYKNNYDYAYCKNAKKSTRLSDRLNLDNDDIVYYMSVDRNFYPRDAVLARVL